MGGEGRDRRDEIVASDGLPVPGSSPSLRAMELRQLRYFLAVAEELNISAAARRLNLTQPALSRQIKALEEELGWTLIERKARSIALTREGEIVQQEGRRMVRAVEAGLERMRLAIEGATLRVGYAPSLAKSFLGVALERFSQVHPKVRVSLSDLSTLEMEEAVVGGRIDVMVGPRNEEVNDIRWVPLRQDGWRLAMPKKHRLADRRSVPVAELDGERLLLLAQDHYPEYWAKLSAFFKEHGINAKVAGEFDSGMSLVAALEGGLGVALVSAAGPLGDSKTLVSRKLEPPPTDLCVAAGLPAGQVSAIVEVFVEELKRASAEGGNA